MVLLPVDWINECKFKTDVYLYLYNLEVIASDYCASEVGKRSTADEDCNSLYHIYLLIVEVKSMYWYVYKDIYIYYYLIYVLNIC